MKTYNVFYPLYDGEIPGKWITKSKRQIAKLHLDVLPDYAVQYDQLDPKDVHYEEKLALIASNMEVITRTSLHDLIATKYPNRRNVFRYRCFSSIDRTSQEATDVDPKRYIDAQDTVDGVLMYQIKLKPEDTLEDVDLNGVDPGNCVVSKDGYVFERKGRELHAVYSEPDVVVKEDTHQKWADYPSYAKQYAWINSMIQEGKVFGITPNFHESCVWGAFSRSSDVNGLQLVLDSSEANEFKQCVLYYRALYQQGIDMSDPYAYFVVDHTTKTIIEECPDGTKAKAFYEHRYDSGDIEVIPYEELYDFQADYASHVIDDE